MPIRPDDRGAAPRDWNELSRRVCERDGQKCRWCWAPNYAFVRRNRNNPSQWTTDAGIAFELDHEAPDRVRAEWGPPTRIVLTVVHLDHDPENDADDNLAALCPRCLKRHDPKLHGTNVAEARARRRDARRGQLGLFTGKR